VNEEQRKRAVDLVADRVVKKLMAELRKEGLTVDQLERIGPAVINALTVTLQFGLAHGYRTARDP